MKRYGIINMQSLIWNQFLSPEYRPMLRYAWRNTDPGYTNSELQSRAPPPLVQDIQFNFNQSSLCEHNCTNYAFIRCSHCGKLMCLDHFLNRTCFHDDEDEGIFCDADFAGDVETSKSTPAVTPTPETNAYTHTQIRVLANTFYYIFHLLYIALNTICETGENLNGSSES